MVPTPLLGNENSPTGYRTSPGSRRQVRSRGFNTNRPFPYSYRYDSMSPPTIGLSAPQSADLPPRSSTTPDEAPPAVAVGSGTLAQGTVPPVSYSSLSNEAGLLADQELHRYYNRWLHGNSRESLPSTSAVNETSNTDGKLIRPFPCVMASVLWSNGYIKLSIMFISTVVHVTLCIKVCYHEEI